jgi:hypothetical protein
MMWKYIDRGQKPTDPAYCTLLVQLRPSADNKVILVETWVSNESGNRVWAACDGRKFNPEHIFKWVNIDEIADSVQGDPDDAGPAKSLSKFFVKKYYRDSQCATPVFGLEACGYFEAECIKESTFDVLASAIRDGKAVRVRIRESAAGKIIEDAGIIDE